MHKFGSHDLTYSTTRIKDEPVKKMFFNNWDLFF